MRTGPLVLLLLLLACESGDSVHVTGAVQNPGRFPFDRTATVDDFLVLAGGVIGEGIRDHAYILRVLAPDSLTEEPPPNPGPDPDPALIQEASLHIPADQVKSLRPNDQIHIPYRTYPVVIDSVKEVHDLDFTHEDRRYRLVHGQLIHGYVDGDIQVAVILGHGLVESFGKGARSAGFHYLYARMHPDQFDRLKPFVSSIAHDRDALEDARVIHGKLFSKAGHTEGDRAIQPPAGYFKVFAGAYPRPKSESRPGSGMRRRRHEDGRVWTTFGDGRQRTRYPDGKVVRLAAEGTKRTDYPDGNVRIRDREGNLRIEHADGRIESKRASGTHILEYPDGRKKTAFYNGTVIERKRDGTKITRYTAGAVSTIFPDGRRVNRFTSGVVETTFPGGRIHIVTETGDTIVRKLDGTEIVSTTTGEEIITFSDGRRIQSSKHAPLAELALVGSRRITTRSGEKTILMADSERRITYPDGTKRTIYPDGRIVVEDTAGNVTVFRTDGTQRKTYRIGSEGERPGMKSLIEVNNIPKSVDVGERIGIGLTLSLAVREIDVGVFHLPRGHVKKIQTTYIDSTYATATHSFSEPGTYRLQVLCSIGGDRWRIAYDRLIRVGGAPSDSLVAEFQPSQSTDAFGRSLFARVNQDRTDLGIDPLKSDAEIDEVMLERLWDILDSRALSGSSFSTGSAEEKMTLRGLLFHHVQEYSAKASNPEDGHIRLMLQDMRYRRSVLDPTWTHVGIAVERTGDDHLFGMIFKK